MKNCKVFVAQIKVSDPEKNTNKIINYIKEASKKKADLILFPETCIYVEPKENPKKFSTYLELIQNACKENNIWCIFTSYNTHKGKKYNTAFLINRNGEIVYTYNKKHLWGDEKKYITAGDKNRIIDTEFGKIGIVICFDNAFPEETKSLSSKGAWIVFCPVFEMGWDDNNTIPKATPIIRAYENSCYFIVCDVCDKNSVSISTIASPKKILKQIIKKEGVIIQDLDYKYIKKLKSLGEPY
jgi:deaminated glutathione amidase